MDEICILMDRLLLWIDQQGPPAIPYVGRAAGRFRNPPAPHLEIVFVLSGGYRDLQVGDQEVLLPEGHVGIHNVHFGNYSTASEPPPETWCLFLDVAGATSLTRLSREPLAAVRPVLQRDLLTGAFTRLASACRRFSTGPEGYLNPTPFYDPGRTGDRQDTGVFHVKGALLSLLALLADEVAAGKDACRPQSEPVLKAMEYLGRHYPEPALRLPDVARAASLSLDHFGRLFRQETGETPMRYLKRLRLNQARQLLEHTGLRIDEVAASVGFPDPFHFSREFRLLVGISPQAYRQQRAQA